MLVRGWEISGELDKQFIILVIQLPRLGFFMFLLRRVFKREKESSVICLDQAQHCKIFLVMLLSKTSLGSFIHLLFTLQGRDSFQSEVKWKSFSRVQLFATPWTCRVHGILQARILKWVAFPFSRRSSQPRDRTQVSHIAGGFFIS